MAEGTVGKVSRTGDPSSAIPDFPSTFPARIEEPIPLKANAYALLFFLPHDPALYHAMLLLQSYFSEGENAILKKRIQEKRFWVLHTGALFYPTLPGFLMGFYSLHLPLFRTYRFMDRVLGLLSEVERDGIPEKRLEELKGRMAIGLLSTLHGTEKKTLRLAECAILRGDAGLFFRDEESLRNLSNEALRDAARRLLGAPRAEILLKGSLWKRS